MSHLLLFSVLAVLAGATSYQRIIAFIAVQRDRLNAAFGACFRRAPAVNTLRNLFLPGARPGRSRDRLPSPCASVERDHQDERDAHRRARWQDTARQL